MPIVTQNGGKIQAGNSPGISQFGSLVIGPGAINNFGWQINDAGPSTTFPNAPGKAGGGDPGERVDVAGEQDTETVAAAHAVVGQLGLDGVGDTWQSIYVLAGDVAGAVYAGRDDDGRGDE